MQSLTEPEPSQRFRSPSSGFFLRGLNRYEGDIGLQLDDDFIYDILHRAYKSCRHAGSVYLDRCDIPRGVAQSTQARDLKWQHGANRTLVAFR
jgi:hypothetical protein